jgi:hypothetical protein
MSRVAIILFVLTLTLGSVVISNQTNAEVFQGKKYTYTGWIHKGCVEFLDPEVLISKGPITRVEVAHGDFIYGLRLYYGQDGQASYHLGLPENELSKWNIKSTPWSIPEGEVIVRIEGEIVGHYISRLKFFTDRGTESPQFGEKSGKAFFINEPDSGGLRTISGHVNQRKHKSLKRAVASMTFYFDPPCYIKDINYDLAALEAARIRATPEGLAHQEIPNRTSVVQSVAYQDTKTITISKTLTFQQSLGFKMGGEVSAGLPGTASAKASFEFSGSTTSGKSYVNTTTQEVSWTVPVTVPPGKKIIVDSTVKRYRAVVPFTYTIAWYSGTRDNIIKEVTLPGVYEGIHVEDLNHEYKEVSLE